jgi:uncharacterized protein (DUF2336 family)
MSHSLPAYRTLIDKLENAIVSGNARHRLRMLQDVTDLFLAGSGRHSGQQLALFDDVLMRLVEEIEVKARSELAKRLATLDKAPARVIRTLAFDDAIEVAAPVLTGSTQLTDADLVENATTKSQDHLYAIAQRLKLSEAVTDVLVERGDRRVVRRVARNDGARFSLAGYDKLVAFARYDRTLALTIGKRSDVPRQYFIKLLETASASVRAKLEAANPEAVAAIRSAVDEVAGAMQQEARETSKPYAVAVRDAKRRFGAHAITEANVHGPARAQEFEKAVVALAMLGHFPVDLVERALLDEGADMVLILAKAAGCSWTTAKALLLMQAAKRGISPEDLDKAFNSFDRLSEATAQRVLKFHERRTKLRVAAPAPSASTRHTRARAALQPAV